MGPVATAVRDTLIRLAWRAASTHARRYSSLSPDLKVVRLMWKIMVFYLCL